MKHMTFKEWNEAGFRVCKGEKAAGRNEAGLPVFTERQVEEMRHYTLTDQEDADFGSAMGIDWHD